jgi:hypothetical protein
LQIALLTLHLSVRYLTEIFSRVLNCVLEKNLLRSFPHGEKICASMPIRHNFSALIKATAPEAFQEFVLK